MTNDAGRKPEGAPERSPKAGAGGPSGVDGNGPKRFSVQRKMAIVARLLHGEPLELVVRETNVSIARLSEWRHRALTGTATALKNASAMTATMRSLGWPIRASSAPRPVRAHAHAGERAGWHAFANAAAALSAATGTETSAGRVPGARSPGPRSLMRP